MFVEVLVNNENSEPGEDTLNKVLSLETPQICRYYCAYYDAENTMRKGFVEYCRRNKSGRFKKGRACKHYESTIFPIPSRPLELMLVTFSEEDMKKYDY